MRKRDRVRIVRNRLDNLHNEFPKRVLPERSTGIDAHQVGSVAGHDKETVGDVRIQRLARWRGTVRKTGG